MSPTLDSIKATAQRITEHVLETPILPYYGAMATALFSDSEVVLKMELLQRTGSFKARGAVNTVLQLDDQQRQSGITAFSAGNHAIATAYAARSAGISAKVVMPKTANPYRVSCCKALGAEIVFGNSIDELMDIVESLKAREGRTLIHPFEGVHTFDGTATIGIELLQAQPDIDAVIVPVGGGGLISGIAAAVKLLKPECRVIGVEPAGAAGMSDSLKLGAPLERVNVNTIADSLGAPLHMPMSYQLVSDNVDQMVQVTDDQLAAMMKVMFSDLQLAVEPACAAAMTALAHPLKNTLAGKKVALILCGSNIDQSTFNRLTLGNTTG
ncbi:MAG: threonine/serine dehydratase [Pseudomonadota bacterium]